jgi:CheY-like chemotaxis protein
MPEEVRRRVFEPFFTTKPPGKGTGLGLAQIHGFAHQSGGTALVASAPGQGTEVAILLPRRGAALRHCIEAVASVSEAVFGSGETVLVVEDDTIVRSALAETLRDLQYRVLEAASADAALAMLDGGTVVDVVLSDLVMPGNMDGLEFALVTGERFPGMPVMLTTGHTSAMDARSLPSGVRVLRKPVSREVIATAVRQALAGEQIPLDA